MILEKQFMKFAPKVKEINRQYEMNNNAELDNGVYHQDDEEDEENKEKKEKVNSLETSFDKNELQNNSEDKMDEKKIQSEIEEGQERKKQSEWQKLEQMIVDGQRTEDGIEVNNNQKNNDFDNDENAFFLGTGIQAAQTLIINENIIGEIEVSGFPR